MNEYDKLEKNKISSTHKNNLNIWIITSYLFNNIKSIIILSLLAAFLIFLGAYAYYILTSSVDVSELNFSLTFDGISENKYPNGTNFSEDSIISIPILQEVYAKNNFKQFFPDFTLFKNSISVQRYNPRLSFLKYEFDSKLKNQNLTSSERYELEREFYRQVESIESKPDFILSLFYPNANVKNISNVITGDILYDILKTWMIQSQEIYGATKYNIPVIINPLNKNFIDNTDYFQTSDKLRKLLESLQNQLSEMMLLPNAYNIIITRDNNKYTFIDLKSMLINTKDYYMTPLFDLLKNSSAINANRNSQVYINESIKDLEFKKNTLLNKKDYLENLLYRKVILSNEKILKIDDEISNIDSNLLFYRSIHDLASSKQIVLSDETIKGIKEYQLKLLEGENLVISLAYEFYEKINKYNLGRNDGFYDVNYFSSYTLKEVKPLYILKISLAVWAVFELIIIGTFILIKIYKFNVLLHLKHDGID